MSKLSPLFQLDGSHSEEVFDHKINAANHHHKQLFEWQYIRLNGECFPAEVLLSPITFNGKSVLLMILRDITSRKTAEQHLLAAKQDAEQAYQVKSQFLSQMSHELRTPLNAVLGFGQLLQLKGSNLTPIQQINVEEILSAGNHLLTLVNDVLDLTQIESGKMTVCTETVPLDKVVHECVLLIKHQCGQRQIQLIDNISGNGIAVEADFTRLKQVMLNLLSNAVKYNCANGEIVLDAQIINNKKVRVSVSDTGNGLSAEQMAKLFVPFERLNASSNIEGNGIGLSICKRLIELMGGSIDVSSHDNCGCVFTIELNLAQTNSG
jgi:signal transduction histidine kinase